MLNKNIEQILIKSVRNNPGKLRDIRQQNEAMCKIAVSQNWRMLQHVHNQTKEICLTALRNNIRALSLIHSQGTMDALSWKAIELDPEAIIYIRQPTYTQFNHATLRGGIVYCHQKKTNLNTDSLEKLMLTEPMRLRFVIEQTERMCVNAVHTNYKALMYVQKQTPCVIMAAIDNSIRALPLVRNQTENAIAHALAKDWRALRYVRHQTEAMVHSCVSRDINAIKFVDMRVVKNTDLLKFIKSAIVTPPL